MIPSEVRASLGRGHCVVGHCATRKLGTPLLLTRTCSGRVGQCSQRGRPRLPCPGPRAWARPTSTLPHERVGALRRWAAGQRGPGGAWGRGSVRGPAAAGAGGRRALGEERRRPGPQKPRGRLLLLAGLHKARVSMRLPAGRNPPGRGLRVGVGRGALPAGGCRVGCRLPGLGGAGGASAAGGQGSAMGRMQA